MTREEQVRFTEDLLNSFKNEIVSKIENGKISSDWDGRYLREYILQKANENINGYTDKKVKKEVKNEIIVNNI